MNKDDKLYVENQQFIQDILFDNVRKVMDGGGNPIDFLIASTGGVMASVVYHIIEMNAGQDGLTPEQVEYYIMEKIVDRYAEDLSALKGENDNIEIISTDYPDRTDTLN